MSDMTLGIELCLLDSPSADVAPDPSSPGVAVGSKIPPYQMFFGSTVALIETSARLTSLTGKVLVCSAADRMSSEEVLVRTMKLTLKKRISDMRVHPSIFLEVKITKTWIADKFKMKQK